MRKNNQLTGANNFWDKTGVAVSWLCAVHCLLMPLLVSLVPLLGFSFLAHEATEYVFIIVSMLVASVSLLPGFFKYHRKINILLLFTAGLGFVVFSDRLFEENLAGKTIFVLLGAGLITAAHLINRRLCRACRACAETVCRL